MDDYLWYLASCEEKMVFSPILIYPYFKQQFILDTVACDAGIGALLFRLDVTGEKRGIAYSMSTSSKAEHPYCITRRQLLAVV